MQFSFVFPTGASPLTPTKGFASWTPMKLDPKPANPPSAAETPASDTTVTVKSTGSFSPLIEMNCQVTMSLFQLNAGYNIGDVHVFHAVTGVTVDNLFGLQREIVCFAVSNVYTILSKQKQLTILLEVHCALES